MSKISTSNGTKDDDDVFDFEDEVCRMSSKSTAKIRNIPLKLYEEEQEESVRKPTGSSPDGEKSVLASQSSSASSGGTSSLLRSSLSSTTTSSSQQSNGTAASASVASSSNNSGSSVSVQKRAPKGGGGPLRKSALGRTKSQRMKQRLLILQQQTASKQDSASLRSNLSQASSFSADDDADDDDSSRRSVRFAPSTTNSSSSPSAKRRRRLNNSKAASSSPPRKTAATTKDDWRPREQEQLQGVELSLQQSKQQSGTTDDVRSKNKTDIFAAQDSGNYQMLKDECTFLCGSIVNNSSSIKNSSKAASDLLYMLSSKQNRRTLFLQSSSSRGNMSAGEQEDDPFSSPLQAVLGVFAWAKTLVVTTGPLQQEQQDAASSMVASGRRRTKSARQRNAAAAALSASPTGSTCSSTVAHHHSNNKQRQLLLDTLAMCLHFVSLDCTDQGGGAGAANNKAARRMRRAILSHADALQGILHLVLSDPLTRRLRRPYPPATTTTSTTSFQQDIMASPVPSIHFTTTKNGSSQQALEAASVASTPTSLASNSPAASTPDSQSSAAAAACADDDNNLDPTVAGRRKRRLLRRQQQEGGAELGTIPELNNADMTSSSFPILLPVASRKHDDTLSFTSASPPRPPFRKSRGGGKSSRNGYEKDDDTASQHSGHSVASSTDTQMLKARTQLDQVTSRILESMSNTKTNMRQRSSGGGASNSAVHSCNETDSDTVLISSSLPLLAISRIVSGRMEGSETSCIDDDQGLEDDEDDDDKKAAREDQDGHNPLLVTNRLLGENGAVPLLAQALAETLTAVTHQLLQQNHHHETQNNNSVSSRSDDCQGCLLALQERVSKLVSLVDGASLLSESNRTLFCEEGFTSEGGGYLIMGLLSVLRCLLDVHGDDGQLFGVWGEITLSMLRMLTSLTHENATAARELQVEFTEYAGKKDETSLCGLDVLAAFLRAAVRSRRADDPEFKLKYDCIIFCLNSLANVVESGGSCRLLAEMTISTFDGESETRFLTWLTRWLVSETRSFRDAVVESTFGNSPSKHTERRLDADEDERLVIAGNGFVLLSCLMLDEDDVDDANDSTSAYKIILADLPGSDRDAKLLFLKNILIAFCNFYHYSIGSLSVAVVAPVKSLISRLEALQEKRRRVSLESIS